MELDAPFWALISLVLFFAVVIYMKVPRTIAGSLDKRAATIQQRTRAGAEACAPRPKRCSPSTSARAKAAEAEAGEIVEQARREAAALSTEARKRTRNTSPAAPSLPSRRSPRPRPRLCRKSAPFRPRSPSLPPKKILAARVRGSAGDSLIAKSIGDVKSKLN